MEKIYQGKTKDVYRLDNGNIQLYFKDDVTGKDGVFDPGANQVGLSIKDNGYYGLIMSKFLFEKIEEAGIKTHYVGANPEARTMEVKDVDFFGKGIEVICRLEATGSFIRRYGDYMADGTKLDYYVEISLKDDEKGDPFIDQELLETFKILQPGEYEILKKLTKEISKIIQAQIEAKGLELIDLKLEFGRDKQGQIILIDELSGGNMRVYDKDRKSVKPIDLAKILLG